LSTSSATLIYHHDRSEGHITISARPLGAFYEFSVTDDGPGIEAKFHDKIFEVFQTLKAKDDGRGTGMGLTLVKRLVESAGGSIEVESQPTQSRGTTFRFTWPKHWHRGS
jgi:signal transduction histidine kinase